MHWPQAMDANGRIFCVETYRSYLHMYDVNIGQFIQPGERPTYVETWLEMEKLLETGG